MKDVGTQNPCSRRDAAGTHDDGTIGLITSIVEGRVETRHQAVSNQNGQHVIAPLSGGSRLVDLPGVEEIEKRRLRPIQQNRHTLCDTSTTVNTTTALLNFKFKILTALSLGAYNSGVQIRSPGNRTTLQQEAYRALRSAIIRRRLQPGTKLLVRTLVGELGLSPTPIKGALSALEREGLVVAVPHRGYFIPRVSPQDIEEIYALRELVDGLAARLAASRADKRLLRRLRALIADQKACVSSRDFEKYGDLDLAFHQCVRRASGNSRLIGVAEAFDGQIRLLIDTSTRARTLSTSVREHIAIADAIAAQDPKAAETAMRHHVEAAGKALQLHVQETITSATPAGMPSLVRRTTALARP